jgi:hypothetical protein
MLLYCLRRTLKPSASAIAISKLYQLFRVRDHPYGLQDSLPTLRPFCSIPLIFRCGETIRDFPGFFSESLLISNRFSINVHLLLDQSTSPPWTQGSIRVGGYPLQRIITDPPPDRDFHPARYAELCSAR